MKIGIFTWIAFLVWVASEIYIIIRTKQLRQNVSATKADKGSFWLIIIGVYVGIEISLVFNFHRWGWVSQSVANVGAILMMIGVALRVWATQVLGRNFSTTVSVDSNQTIIRTGPYKIVRHPTYSGALITLISMGLAMNSWIAPCILFWMLFIIYGYRIHVEEKVLVSHFGSDYEEYRKNTWKIIPYLW